MCFAKGLVIDSLDPAVKLNPELLGAVNCVLKLLLLLPLKGGNDWLVLLGWLMVVPFRELKGFWCCCVPFTLLELLN